MGLTHIAFHERKPWIIELHNPTIGTDAYAFVAHALGFKYQAIFGADLGGDTRHFNIRPRDVIDALLLEEIFPMAATDGGVPLQAQTRLLAGVQSGGITEVLDMLPPRADCPVYRHIRNNAIVQPDNNCGWLEASNLIKGAVYHYACEVWIPSNFKCDGMTVSCLGFTSRDIKSIDLSKRDQWQTVRVNGVATDYLVNFVLRCDAEESGVFYSSVWRFGFGIDLG
jgi:hypothetical protein